MRGLGFRVWGLGVPGLGFRGSGFGVEGFGVSAFRIWVAGQPEPHYPRSINHESTADDIHPASP